MSPYAIEVWDMQVLKKRSPFSPNFHRGTRACRHSRSSPVRSWNHRLLRARNAWTNAAVRPAFRGEDAFMRLMDLHSGGSRLV